MRPEVKDWVAGQVEKYHLENVHSVLEVGSRNINGSVRSLFMGAYRGIDMEDGPGVDSVVPAWELTEVAEYDVVVSTETLEHDPWPWRSLPAMAQALKPGGYMILTAAGLGFPQHDYPSDFWRFTEAAFAHLFEMCGLETLETDVLYPDTDSAGIFGIARKPE